MKTVRQAIEFSYARAEQLWPYLNKKDDKKLEGIHTKVAAEVRVMYLLTNFKVCCSEGNTWTGERGLECVPPSLEKCLAMNPNE